MGDLIDRSKRLIDYCPPFMQQFREMKEIMHVEDTKFDQMASDTEKILNNAFIEDCDEYGIKKYENLLGIIITPEDTLETRKSRVLLYWNNEIPYTYRVLVEKLNILCGVNNYDIVPELENYRIDFNIYNELQIAELEKLLEKMLPVNIAYSLYVAASHLGVANMGVVWQDDEIFSLRQVVL